MKFIIASFIALILLASFTLLSYQLFSQNHPRVIEKEANEKTVIYNKNQLVFNNTECSEIRTSKKQLYEGQHTCQTTDDCELVHISCSYVAMNTKNSNIYKALRTKEYEVCSNHTIASCLKNTPKEALCIKNECQTVRKIDINDEIKITVDNIRKAAN